LRDAMTSFTDSNIGLAEGLKQRDREIDRVYNNLMTTFVGQLETPHGKAESLLHLIFVIRSLERIADLAVNIGEDAVFLGNAQDIRHVSRIQAVTNDASGDQ